MKKKVPAAVWVIITFVIFALLAWWAYMMLNHVRNDASGAYTITTQVAEGEGTVTPAKEKAGAKEKVDVAIKAGDDFVVNTVMAKAEDGGDVEISTKDSGGEVFTLVMPDPGQNVTVTVHFTPADGSVQAPTINSDAPTVHYVDVDTSKWYSDAISYVTIKGYMSGIGKGAFNPDGQVTRAELAQMLYAMDGSPEVEVTTSFSDVPADQWYAKAISWATQNAIVSGYDAATFGPNDPVTRQQMAAILYQYAVQRNYKTDTADPEVLAQFSDGNLVAPYAANAMAWAVKQGIISGYKEWVEPLGPASRAQTAAILKSFEENIKQ